MALTIAVTKTFGSPVLETNRARMILCDVTIGNKATDYTANGLLLSAFDSSFTGGTSVVAVIPLSLQTAAHAPRPYLLFWDPFNRSVHAYVTATGAEIDPATTEIANGDVLTCILVVNQPAV